MLGGGWFVSNYRVSPNFFVVLGLRLWLRLGLGCDNIHTGCPKKRVIWESGIFYNSNVGMKRVYIESGMLFY